MPQVSIEVNPVTVETDPGTPFNIEAILHGVTIDEVSLEVLRYEDLVGTWVTVPGIIVEKYNNFAIIELRAPNKEGTYRFKLRVLSNNEVLAESQEVKVVVGTDTSAQNITSGANENLSVEIVPSQYLFTMIGIIPAFSFLLWRGFRSRQ